MKCEICHKAEAAAVLHRKNARGETEELYVCKACKTAARREQKKPAPENEDGEPAQFAAEVFGPGGGEPPEFVKNLLNATIGFVKGISQTEKKGAKKCPVCGQTWEKLCEDQRLGCPNCWKFFSRDLREKFDGQYGLRHKGKIPSAAETHGVESREWLENELKKAVEKEDFRRAAELRRKLDAGEDGR